MAEEERKGPEKRRFRRLETNIVARVKPVEERPSAADDDDEGKAEGDGDEKAKAKGDAPIEPFEVVITNLGPEGAFVRTDTLLPVQSKVSLGFKLDSYPREIDVVATILWERRGDGVQGMGMHFTRIPLFEKNVIIDYILRRYAEFHSGRP